MVSDLKTFACEGYKTAAHFFLGGGNFAFGIGATIRIGREMLCLPYAGFFFYRIRNKMEPYFIRVYILYVSINISVLGN